MSNPYANWFAGSGGGRTPVSTGGGRSYAPSDAGYDYGAAAAAGAHRNQTIGNNAAGIFQSGLEQVGANQRTNTAAAAAMFNQALEKTKVLADARQRNRTARQMQLDALAASKPSGFEQVLAGVGVAADVAGTVMAFSNPATAPLAAAKLGSRAATGFGGLGG